MTHRPTATAAMPATAMPLERPPQQPDGDRLITRTRPWQEPDNLRRTGLRPSRWLHQH